MEIRSPRLMQQTINQPSIITVENSTYLGHDKSCNCYYCSDQQSTKRYYKYVQPERAKSYRPIRPYSKSTIPMDGRTCYKMSFWESPIYFNQAKAFKPNTTLTFGDDKMTDETIHKLSYYGNWNIKKEDATLLRPKGNQLFGRGPMQDSTISKDAYTWKEIPRPKPLKVPNNIYCPRTAMTDKTIYNDSYYESACIIPTQSFKPPRRYIRHDTPMEGCTTYKLSYWPYEAQRKESYPWKQKMEYQRPPVPIDDTTTYNLSYWPNEPVRETVDHTIKDTENILNASDCFDDNTTYDLSYLSTGENAKREIMKPQMRPVAFAPCPLSHDTINRLSYLGNWNVKSEPPYNPNTYAKMMFGRGPMQDTTVHKQDFTWKYQDPPTISKADHNLGFSSSPIDSCTTHNLSYFPNDPNTLIKTKSAKRQLVYQLPDIPFEAETTMRLSYQPVDIQIPQKKTWAPSSEYHPPVIPMDDNTIHNHSYIPPGTLVQVDECGTPYPPCYPHPSYPSCAPLSNMCQATYTPLHSLSPMKNSYCSQCPS